MSKKIENDNRMLWIRNIESLHGDTENYHIAEYEIASECRISGVLDYDNEKILCGLTTLEKDNKGLYYYLAKIKYPKINEPYFNKRANKKGYYFPDGIIGELISLFSLYFGVRFYLNATYSGKLTKNSMRIKETYNFLYRHPDEELYSQVFNSKNNFSKGLPSFLDKVKKLDEITHQQFILACYNYSNALKEIGINREMIFIKLVSSIESLSQEYILEEKDNPLNKKNFDEIFEGCQLTIEQKQQLKNILSVDKNNLINVSKCKMKFIKFIEEYSKNYLKNTKQLSSNVKISKEEFHKKLEAIYDARSNYLHNGEPMYFSVFIRGMRNWDKDPTSSTIIDNRKLSDSIKLPYETWFIKFVRCCLLNYLEIKEK